MDLVGLSEVVADQSRAIMTAQVEGSEVSLLGAHCDSNSIESNI